MNFNLAATRLFYSSVVADTPWISNITCINSLDYSGIFLFADQNYDIKYVGRFGAGRLDFEIKCAINHGKFTNCSLIKILYTNSFTSAISLERELKKI